MRACCGRVGGDANGNDRVAALDDPDIRRQRADWDGHTPKNIGHAAQHVRPDPTRSSKVGDPKRQFVDHEAVREFACIGQRLGPADIAGGGQKRINHACRRYREINLDPNDAIMGTFWTAVVRHHGLRNDAVRHHDRVV